MSEQLKKETGLSQPAGSEGPKKSAAKKSFFRSRSGEKKKSAAKSAQPAGQKKSAAKKAPAKEKASRTASKAVIDTAADAIESVKKPVEKAKKKPGIPKPQHQKQTAGHPFGRPERNRQKHDRL